MSITLYTGSSTAAEFKVGGVTKLSFTSTTISIPDVQTGILKTVAGVVTASVAGVDYLAPPSGTALLMANSGGALANAVAGTHYAGISSVQTLTATTIRGLKEVKTAPTVSAGVLSIDCSAGNLFAVALNAAITSFTVTNIPAAGTTYGFVLEFTADGTPRNVTWTFGGITVRWPGGTLPVLTATNGKKDIFSFYTYDGGSTWIGSTVGLNF